MFLTRGFASQPRGWFAVSERVPNQIVFFRLASKADASRQEIRFAVCFGRNWGANRKRKTRVPYAAQVK